MKLYVLNGGITTVEKAFLWHFGSKEDEGKEYEPKHFTLAMCQYYIEHPEARILFDVGWKLEEIEPIRGFPARKDPDGVGAKQEPDENLVGQLQKIGVSIDDIDYVVPSHLMFDHAAWLSVFADKKAQIIVEKKEYDYAHRIGVPPIQGEPLPVEQFHSWMYHRDHFEIPGLNYKLVEGDYEIVQNVKIIHSPGHTPGYIVLLVRLPKTGTVFLSACELVGSYYSTPINGNAPGIPHSFTWFHAEELASFKKIRELVEKENGQIFCGHDWAQFNTLKQAPEYYE